MIASVARLRALGAVLALALGSACEVEDDARSALVVDVLTRADEPLLRTRPQLVERKYQRMASSRFAFFRGSFPLFLHDAQTDGALAATEHDPRAFPLSVGDAHPENVGTLLGPGGALTVEPNDLDGAERWPWSWEVRRLALGMVLAAAESNEGDDDARRAAVEARADIARAVGAGYADAILRVDRGADRVSLVDPATSPHLADLLQRGAEDAETREELAELTVVGDDGHRRLVRGSIDPDDAENVLIDVADLVRDGLDAALAGWRRSLGRDVGDDFVVVRDVARELGSGVASRPRVRLLVLVEGPTRDAADDVILEVKEVADPGGPTFVPPGVSADVSPAQRAVHAAHTVWLRPDAEPLWGHTTLLGLPVQVRAEREAHKTLRVARMTEELGTPEALVDLGATLGTLLARVHAGSERLAPGTVAAIAASLRDREAAFAEEIARVAVSWADRVADDHARFQAALDERGPRLGFAADATDALDPEEQALFGVTP